MRLTPGRWRIRFVGALTEPEGCVIDVVSSHGRVWHAAVPCTPQIGEVEIALHAPSKTSSSGCIARPGGSCGWKASRCHASTSFLCIPMSSCRPAAASTSMTGWNCGCCWTRARWSTPGSSPRAPGNREQIDRIKNAILAVGLLPGKKVFLDVGSYFGLYSMQMNRLGLLDRILTFEADAFNFRQLDANLLVNDPASRIERNFAAVSDEDGEVSFFFFARAAGWKPRWRGHRQRPGGADCRGRHRGCRTGSCERGGRCSAHRPGRPAGHRLRLQGLLPVLQDRRGGARVRGAQRHAGAARVQPVLPADRVPSGRLRPEAAMEAKGYKYLGTIAVDHYFANYDPASL